MNVWVTPFREALEALDRVSAERIFNDALLTLSPIEAIEEVAMPALEFMGAAWESGELALSQIYMSGRICESLVEQVLPPSDPDRKRQPRSAIVVLSDYHMLGKRIVYSLMRASGFELFDYGRMNPDELLERIKADRIRVLMISVLMLPAALKVAQVCAGIKAEGLPTRVLVGGAPFLFDPQLWREVGADAMGRNAAEAITVVQRWMGELQ